jgi:hypothetical protein
MIKYAFIRDGIVRLIEELDPEVYATHVPHWDCIIDIQNQSPAPAVGWMLIGNTLVPVSPATQQAEQQIFGASLTLELVNKMGARNLALAQSGTSVNVAALLGTVGTVKSLMETGALKTARTLMQMYSPSFPQHSDIMNEGVLKITAFLSAKGWD